MRIALAAFGLFALAGCARATEGMVREQAASQFSCADYALHVQEVGPDVYRASGCGQELIYACQPVTMGTSPPNPAAPKRGAHARRGADPDEVADTGHDAAMVCARRLP